MVEVLNNNNNIDGMMKNVKEEEEADNGTNINRYGINNDKYYLSEEEIVRYNEDGYLHLKSVAPKELLLELDKAFDNLILNEENIMRMGKDIGDINGEVGKNIKDNAGISIMLPKRYYKNLNNNKYLSILESRCAHITLQLFGDNMLFDFDRFIAKKPNRNDAIFEWHQDEKYCLSHGDIVTNVKDNRAAIFSIALDNTTQDNGCIQYIIGSHKEEILRTHIDIEHNNHNNNNNNNNNKIEVVNKVTKTIVDLSKDHVRMVPIQRGDLTVHGPRIVHGSGGNYSNGWRRNYMIQFRSQEQVQQMITLGLSRSFNIIM